MLVSRESARCFLVIADGQRGNLLLITSGVFRNTAQSSRSVPLDTQLNVRTLIETSTVILQIGLAVEIDCISARKTSGKPGRPTFARPTVLIALRYRTWLSKEIRSLT